MTTNGPIVSALKGDLPKQARSLVSSSRGGPYSALIRMKQMGWPAPATLRTRRHSMASRTNMAC